MKGLYSSHGHVVNIADKRLKREDYYESSECKISMSLPPYENIIRCHDSEKDENFIYITLECCIYNLNYVIVVSSLYSVLIEARLINLICIQACILFLFFLRNLFLL